MILYLIFSGSTSIYCRLLNKACVNTDSTTSGWMLSPVTHVEETKQMLRMIPILAATLIPSAMVAQIGTLFVKQGITLDRGIGSFNRFREQIPKITTKF